MQTSLLSIHKAATLGAEEHWVAVKEFTLSYYIVGTILITIYTHYGNLIQVP